MSPQRRSFRVPLALALSALAAVGLSTLSAQADNLKPGTKAPNFSGKASDGKTYSLASLKATKKVTVIYFIGSTCPVNAMAVKHFNAIASAYKGKVNFIGVIDTDPAGYKVWQERFKAPFPVICDPELKIITSYKAERSPWSVAVGADGLVKKEWVGYSTGYLTQISSFLATGARTSPAKINFPGAPAKPQYG